MRSPEEKENIELTPLVGAARKPLRKICRCPNKEIESGDSSDQQRMSGESLQNTDIEEITRQTSKNIGMMEESLFRFGPLFGLDNPSVVATKEIALEHVLKNSSEDDRSLAMDNYATAIRKVEAEASETYAENMSGTGSSFLLMMIKDGCFFLQLALLILGATSEQLGYPSNDPIFGRKHNKKDIVKWVESMFFVGNQIPFVVLKELMTQKFFTDAIAEGKWDSHSPPSSLCERVLYELLVLPSIKRNKSHQWLTGLKERVMGRDINGLAEQMPSDILHALQILVIGPHRQDHLSDVERDAAEDDIDLEANNAEEDIDDHERIIVPSAVGDGNDQGPSSSTDIVNRLRNFLHSIGFSNAINNQKRILPSATELKRAGIHIKKLKNGGIRSIHFKSYYFWANLYLPVFPVDDHTEIIFKNLKNYEISPQLVKQKREISSYLKVMSDLIQTRKDVKLLDTKGIIDGSSSDKEKLPGVLGRLSSEDVTLTNEFRILKQQIRDYSSPWIHFKGIINVVVFLTLLQTIFTTLAYLKPRKY